MEERGDQRVQVYRSTAEYLATINRGPAQKWSYELKTHARPRAGRRASSTPNTTCRAKPSRRTTWSSIPRASPGIRASRAEPRPADPKTGKVTEYPIDVHKPGFPTGLLGLRSDKAGNLWLGNMYQATIVKFERKTTKFTTWKLPPEQNIDAAQVNMVSPQAMHVDGKVWTQNTASPACIASTSRREDRDLGAVQERPKGEPHNIYDVIPDSQNNAYFTDFRWRTSGASTRRPVS